MSKNNRSRGPEKDRGTSPPFDYKKQTNADDKQRIHLGFDSKFSSNQLKAPSNNSPVNVDKSKKLFSVRNYNSMSNP